MSYAKTTQVSIDKTRSEIEALLIRRGGADGFASAWDKKTGRQILEFRVTLAEAVRVVRIDVPMPSLSDREFQRTKHHGRQRTKDAAEALWEQACRQRWRQTKLIILAKLEAIECEISTFEREFLADLVMPDGRTIAEHAIPNLPAALDGGSPLALGVAG